MSKWKSLGLMLCSMVVLVACGENENKKESSASSSQAEILVSTDFSDIEGSGDNLDDMDFDLSLSDQDKIDWDNIHLSKREFKKLLKNVEEESSGSEEDLLIEGIDFKKDTIHIKITNPEEDESIAKFSNSLFAVILDSFIRQLYLQSDYSNGEKQPIIIIEDINHGIASELNDFSEFGSE